MASMLLGEGVPVTVVSQLLGHASSAITLKVYSHLMRDHLGTAALAMNSLMEDTEAVQNLLGPPLTVKRGTDSGCFRTPLPNKPFSVKKAGVRPNGERERRGCWRRGSSGSSLLFCLVNLGIGRSLK